MLSNAKYSWKLYRLKKSKQKTRLKYEKDLREAKQRKVPRDELEELYYFDRMERELLDDEIAKLQTKFLRQRADELSLPLPPFNEDGPDWEESQTIGGWQLSLSARADLVEKVHAREMALWERRTKWVMLLIGLVGALIGLVSVLKL